MTWKMTSNKEKNQVDEYGIKLKMGNVPKRQSPAQRAENSRRPPIGLQYRKKSHTRRCALAGP